MTDAQLRQCAPDLRQMGQAARIGAEVHVERSAIHLLDGYQGDGRAGVRSEELAVVARAAREGLLLDPVYTGRAMAGLIDMIRKRLFSPEQTVLFWHTGGLPALFEHAKDLAPA